MESWWSTDSPGLGTQRQQSHFVWAHARGLSVMPGLEDRVARSMWAGSWAVAATCSGAVRPVGPWEPYLVGTGQPASLLVLKNRT